RIGHPDFAGNGTDINALRAFQACCQDLRRRLTQAGSRHVVEDIDPTVPGIGHVEPIVRIRRYMVREAHLTETRSAAERIEIGLPEYEACGHPRRQIRGLSLEIEHAVEDGVRYQQAPR